MFTDEKGTNFYIILKGKVNMLIKNENHGINNEILEKIDRDNYDLWQN